MRALCTLPNASAEISGVTFESTPQGMLSRPLDPEDAARFGAIPGYVLVDDAPDVETVEQAAPRRARKSDVDPKP